MRHESGHRYPWIAAAFIAIAVIASGCGAAPEVRIDSARSAINEARAAGAEDYAGDQLRRAEDYLADAVRLQSEGEADKASEAVDSAVREARAAKERASEAVIAAKESAAERADRERRQATEAARRAAEERRASEDAARRAETQAAPAPVMDYPLDAGRELLPAGAKAGECYTRVFVAPTYRTVTEKVLKRQASERIETIPARYEWAEERVLVQEAATKLVEVPAAYETVSEKVLVSPARTVWKKGTGPIQRIDGSTGEIMCLVEIPAEYRTVSKTVLKSPATTKTIEIPAVYKTIKVKRQVEAAKERRIEIPAEYQTVTRRDKASEGRMEWRQILCQTNVRPGIVRDIQRALVKAGYQPGPVDGVLGKQTMAAVTSFQKDKGLAVGPLTFRTLDALGVRVRTTAAGG